jgi:glycosyltransferase involved in cell wall biosynthesis
VSSGAEEALGLTFVEAQATGLPVVSYNTGGVAEAVIHGETGFLARDCDIEGLAEATSILFEHPDLCSAFAQRGIAHVRKWFDLSRQTLALEDIYEEVIAKSNGRTMQTR